MVSESQYIKCYNFIKECKEYVVSFQQYELAACVRDVEVTFFLRNKLEDEVSSSRYVFDSEGYKKFDLYKFIKAVHDLSKRDVSKNWISREFKLRILLGEDFI